MKETWLRRKLYNEDVKWDTLKLGRLTIHLCGPWDYGAPLRLHVNYFQRGYRCSYCGSAWATGISCSKSCKPGRGSEARPRWGRGGWHLAIPLNYPDIYGNPDPNHKHTWFSFTRKP